MKIHLRQVPLEGLHLEGEEAGDILDLKDEKIRQASPVRYSLDIGLSDGGLFATGTVGVDLDLECVCCLERFDYTVIVPDFAVQVELNGAELVDLTDQVREDILLALPPYPHCDWAGTRTCAGVRNVTITREASDQENPWTELDKLTKPKD